MPRPLQPALSGSTIAPLVATAILATLAAARPGFAQEEFELDDTDNWVLEQAPEPGTPEGYLHIARRALAAGHSERAVFLSTQWIERHEQHPLLADAYMIRGDALMTQENYYEALYDYELVARTYTGSEVFVTALERELEIADLFAHGKRRKLWGLRILSAKEEAEELLIRVQERLPGSRLAEKAGMALGDFYFRERSMSLAAEMYSLFIENYPRSDRITKARKHLIYAHIAAFKGPEFDASGLVEAKTRLQALRANDPVTAEQIGVEGILTRIDDSEARKLFVTAEWYLATNDPIAAELTLRRLLERYPRTVAATASTRLGARLLAKLPASVRAEAPNYQAMLGGGSEP